MSQLAETALAKLMGQPEIRAKVEAPNKTQAPSAFPSVPVTATANRRVKDPTYLGKGRYHRRGRGEIVKVSIYLPPGLARALKAAAASQTDENGSSLSEIVETLLKRAGYGG